MILHLALYLAFPELVSAVEASTWKQGFLNQASRMAVLFAVVPGVVLTSDNIPMGFSTFYTTFKNETLTLHKAE